MSFTTCKADSVLPKRILAFQSIWLLFLNCFLVFSMASRCSGRNTIGVWSCDISAEDNDSRPSFTAVIARLTVSRSVMNHSLALFSVSNIFFLMPERSKTLCTSLSLKEHKPFLLLYMVSSVYKRSYTIPAVCVYWLMRFFADSLRALLFGARSKTLSLSQVASPTFRHPLCAASLMRNTYISFNFSEDVNFILHYFMRSINRIRFPIFPVLGSLARQSLIWQ